MAFVDLETVCVGNPIFDYAFCVAHLLLHVSDTPIHAQTIFNSFANNYRIASGGISFQEEDIIVLILGTYMYRLDNKNVPYKLELDEQHKKKLVMKIMELFKTNALTYKNLFEII